MTKKIARLMAAFLLAALSFTAGILARRAEIKREQETLAFLRQRIGRLAELEPDVGDSMRELQFEMAKLWFAQMHHNVPLSLYEIKEMKETIGTVGILNPVVNGVKVAGVLDAMANAQLKEMAQALRRNDDVEFKKQYDLTLATCNQCHRTSGYGFNRITIPTFPPVPNQDWEPETIKGEK